MCAKRCTQRVFDRIIENKKQENPMSQIENYKDYNVYVLNGMAAYTAWSVPAY